MRQKKMYPSYPLLENNMKKRLKKLPEKHQYPLWLMAKAFLLLFFILIVYSVSSKINNKETKQTKLQEEPTVVKTHKTAVNANPTVMPASSTPPARATYPSQVLNLTNWKITLPIGAQKDAAEIKQPELATYNINPWFIVVPDGRGVRFRAAVNGATTSGSDYSRSELREMTNNGTEKASWSSIKGTHTMFLDQEITAVPKIKRHIIAGQIHDDNKDVIVVRLDYPILHIRVDGKNLHTLDSSYILGKRFTIKFVVNDGQTKVYYNNSPDPVYTLNKKYSDAYFKTGAYTQSNCKREDSLSLCNDNNYGEVIVYQATVAHQ